MNPLPSPVRYRSSISIDLFVFNTEVSHGNHWTGMVEPLAKDFHSSGFFFYRFTASGKKLEVISCAGSVELVQPPWFQLFEQDTRLQQDFWGGRKTATSVSINPEHDDRIIILVFTETILPPMFIFRSRFASSLL